MMTTDYCVVIPAHNAAPYVADTVASVPRQTVRRVEIVVSDDGSSDDTVAMARAAGATVLEHPSASGPSASRNRGVAATRAPFIAFVDADDEWMPEHAAALLEAMQAHGSVFAASGAEKFGSESGVLKAELRTDVAIDLRDILIVDNPVIQSGVMVSRNTFVDAGGYDESLRMSEDYDLWGRIAERGGFSYVDQPSVRRRMHDGQATFRYEGDLVKASWLVRRRAVARRLASADAAERDRLLDLMEAAASADIERAIWTGQATILDLLRDELRASDEMFALEGRLASLGGKGAPARRVAQDMRRVRRSLIQIVRGQR